MSSTSDPHLCSTSVLEDVENHDDIIGLKLSYISNECYFTVCLSNEKPNLPDVQKSPVDGADGHVIPDLIRRFNEACTWTATDVTVEDIDKRLDPLWQEAEDLVRVSAFDAINSISRADERTLAPNGTNYSDSKTLAEYIWPKTFNLQLVQVSDRLCIVRRPDLPPGLPFAVEPDIPECSELMCARPNDIKILDKYRAHVLKVEIDGHIFCCKLNNTGAQTSFLREFVTLNRISNAALIPEARIPQLRGVVASEEGVLGFLVDMVDSEAPDLMSLLRLRNDITQSLRQRWKDQISETVQSLHSLGIIWGDAKTGNILVDRKYDAWLVDFGGGFTRGWVDEALSDTKAGDLQGLRNTFLDIFNQR